MDGWMPELRAGLTFSRIPYTSSVLGSLASRPWPCVWRPAHTAAFGQPASHPAPHTRWAWKRPVEKNIEQINILSYSVIFGVYSKRVDSIRVYTVLCCLCCLLRLKGNSPYITVWPLSRAASRKHCLQQDIQQTFTKTLPDTTVYHNIDQRRAE